MNTPTAAACVLLLLMSSARADVPAPRPLPDAVCIDARSASSTRPLSDSQLLLVDTAGNAARLSFDPACLGEAGFEGNLELLSAEGFVCEGRRALLRRAGESPLCPVLGLELLDSRALAEALRSAPGESRLAQVEVRGRRQRAFAGTHDYCFAERHAISYSEDPEGLIVKVLRRRSGGNSRYRVVLADVCPDLWRWYSIGFRSGTNNGVICGNVGDAVMEQLEFDQSPVAGFTMAQQSLSKFGDRCAISEVYPLPD